MFLPAFAAALALQALPAPESVRWENVANQGGETVDIDPSSIARDGEIATAILRVRVGPQTQRNGIAMLVVRQAMNCRTGQFAIMSGNGYGVDGQLLSSLNAPGTELHYTDPPPGPDSDRLHRRMCGDGGA